MLICVLKLLFKNNNKMRPFDYATVEKSAHVEGDKSQKHKSFQYKTERVFWKF